MVTKMQRLYIELYSEFFFLAVFVLAAMVVILFSWVCTLWFLPLFHYRKACVKKANLEKLSENGQHRLNLFSSYRSCTINNS